MFENEPPHFSEALNLKTKNPTSTHLPCRRREAAISGRGPQFLRIRRAGDRAVAGPETAAALEPRKAT